ncbi:rhombosortase [Microbulbifer elongatus]|uniref:rhombosortase n=1 Tax=Microbulbifer elongatus TaxID=86173 RepID=UPI001E64D75E|nr:rhombosortase [Microbulbifer elongatus]
MLQYLQSLHPDWFMYDRALLASGQWWRLLSGHLVHTNLAHLMLNAAAVVALWFVFGQSALLGRRPVAAYLGLTALLAVLISLGLWVCYPGVEIYYGLSGVLHGLFCFGALSDLYQRRWSGALLLIGCWAKVAWELTAGASATTAEIIGAEVAVSSHLLGTVFGSLSGAIVWFWKARQ